MSYDSALFIFFAVALFAAWYAWQRPDGDA